MYSLVLLNSIVNFLGFLPTIVVVKVVAYKRDQLSIGWDGGA